MRYLEKVFVFMVTMMFLIPSVSLATYTENQVITGANGNFIKTSENFKPSVLPYASTTALTVAQGIFGAGLVSCDGAAQFLQYTLVTGQFPCGTFIPTSPASPLTGVQYNNGGNFGASLNFIYHAVSGFVGLGGTSTPSSRLSVTGGNIYNGGNLFNAGTITSTSSKASTIPYASTTAISSDQICFTGDICRSTWPTGGSGTFPFTPTTNYNMAVNATNTPIWFQAGIMSSSTATTTNFAAVGTATSTVTQANLLVGVDSGLIPTGFGNIYSNKEGASNQIFAMAHGANGSQATAGFGTFSSRGTSAAPTASQLDDPLYFMGTRGYGATAYSNGSKAVIQMTAAENWTDTNQGTYISLGTTPLTSTTRREIARFDSTGFLGLGTTSPSRLLSVHGGGSYIGGNEFVAGTITSTSSNASTIPYASTTGATVSGSAYFATDDAGKVGIGTAAPGTVLDISYPNASADLIVTFRNTSNASAAEGIRMWNWNGDIIGDIFGFSSSATAGYADNLVYNASRQSASSHSFRVQSTEYANISSLRTYIAPKLGVGTTTPSATFAIAGVAGTPPIYVSTSSVPVASTTLFMIDPSGWSHYGGGTPTLSTCGTSPTLGTNSTDQAGTITFGATASACTLTFSQAAPSLPHCVITTEAVSLVNAYTITKTVTGFTITQAASGGVSFDYFCPLGH